MTDILFLIDHIWNSNGGTEGQLLMLLNNLDPEKYRPHLFCLKETPWTMNANLNIPLRVLHIRRLTTPALLPKLILFRRYCRENNIEIIQTYFNDALIFGVLAGRLSGVKNIIACRRNLGPGFWGRKDLLLAFKLLRGMITRYMANSEATRDSISHHEKIDPDKIDVIYNGLDIGRFSAIDEKMRADSRRMLGLDESHVLIGMVAHLRKEKNIPLFVEGARRLREKYGQTRFMLMGEGDSRGEIESLIRAYGLEKEFVLTGSIMDIVPYLAAMDIGCLTSDGESFSNSIIEYQAASLPVVATALGGNIEAVVSTDFLFPRGDLESFVGILSRLIEDRELRIGVGKAGRERAEQRYSVAAMVAGHEAMYEKCRRGL